MIRLSNSWFLVVVLSSIVILAGSFDLTSASRLFKNNGTLYSHLFNKVKNSNLTTLLECYDNNWDGKPLDIFRQPLGEIIRGYFAHFREDAFNWKERAFVLARNIRRMVHTIHQCLHQPSVQRTRSGLTSMSIFSEKEYADLQNNNLQSFLEKLPNNVSDDSAISLGSSENFGYDCFDDVDMKREAKKLPKNWNWQEENLVTPVKYQGSCASCFIFAATATVESAYTRVKNIDLAHTEVDFSEQATLDCLSAPNVCSTGGDPGAVFRFFTSKGLTDTVNQPYTAVENQNHCVSKKKFRLRTKIDNWCFSYASKKPWSDDEIKYVVYNYGPTVGAINSHEFALQSLGNSNFNQRCSSTKITHAITIVGWTEDYWIIKNSWGKNWGKMGYLWLKRGDNNCGINSLVTAPVLNQ